MNGLDIVQRVYRKLRRPSQQSLPYQSVVDKVREVISRKKLDLALSEQNNLARRSEWFVPSGSDFSLEELGLEGGVLLPIRVEVKGIDSEFETGDNVPVVDFGVLDTSIVGAVSFYGDPIRMSFRDQSEYVTSRQYRIVYESDFEDEVGLESIVGLPAFFGDMVVVEAAWDLLDEVEDNTTEWQAYAKSMNEKWKLQMIDKRAGWDRYVRMFKGRAQVPKRTFWQNQRGRYRTRYFRG
jgi:hypothetical protein